MKEILRTRRLLLREMTEGDIPGLEEMLLDVYKRQSTTCASPAPTPTTAREM